ncbi:MAG: 3-phosphoshikimate 1-carboxyvinyltransferase [marine bacterium B5-7]|nr:MAG: 3-phosphoshikimate 1-carboxyvinyltransferase [marine bacterium B5-7]
MAESYNIEFIIQPGSSLGGSMMVPGDKSISHRTVMLGSIADGQTRVSGLLEGEDVIATVSAMRAMGVDIDGPANGEMTIAGVGMHGLSAPPAPLDFGNSGTAMRLMCGLLAAQSFASELSGDESLLARPMERVARPLREMGANIETSAGKPPILIQPASDGLLASVHHLEVASAQVKSALLLAGLYARGETRVIEPAITRDHTERMLRAFGIQVHGGEDWASVSGDQKLIGTDVEVPGDLSSASFFLVGAAISPDTELTISDVGVNPTRTGIIRILEAMGATIDESNPRDIAGEPVADLTVHGAQLTGIDIPPSWVPLAIDEFPAVCIAAAAASGTTVIRGAAELRVKESDRIAAMTAGLRNLNIHVDEFDDGIAVTGGMMSGGQIDSFGDHRIAMAFAIAGIIASDTIRIANCRNVATSFPGFAQIAADAGLDIEERINAGD